MATLPIGKGVTVFDGATGTVIQSMGLRPGLCPDIWCLEAPLAVAEVHRRYVEAGAQVVETNTFGATSLRLAHFGLQDRVRDINVAAVRIAREVAGGKALVAGCIGPLGSLVEPLGEVTFDQAYDAFAAQVDALIEGGPDLLVIDTIADLNEMRAAILACKDRAPDVPLIAHMTLDPRGRSFTGTSPEVAGVVMQSMGADAVGFNCSVGPDLLVDAVKRLAAVARVPVSVQPNAGLPRLGTDGRTMFPMGPEEFASYGPRLVAAGASIVGGCCGTTPEHIRLLRGAVSGLTPGSDLAAGSIPGGSGSTELSRVPVGPLGREFCLASRTQAVFAVEENLPLLIGERINPTGRKALTRDISEDRFTLLRQQARSQVEAGAVILDVNVGVPLIDETRAMSRAVKAVQDATPVPVSIDSTSSAAIEAGLRSFVGKALVNSVSLEEGKAESLLPIAKRYGAAVLGLTIDEKGIPATAEARLDIARRLVEKAESYGIPRWDVVIDPLALTAGAQQSQAVETLKAVRLIREELGCRTSLGVSNVSFGLPSRSFLNAVYLNMALSAGLDMAIVNPTDERIMDTVRAVRVFLNRDVSAKQYIGAVGPKKLVHTEDEALVKHAAAGGKAEAVVAGGKPPEQAGVAGGQAGVAGEQAGTAGEQVGTAGGQADQSTEIREAVLQGDKDAIVPLIEQALQQGESPISLLDDHLIPAINQVGKLFADGVYFLPQLMLSASAMKAAFETLRPAIARAKAALGQSGASRGTVVLATVEGDIHDIGKNIVSVLMENHGFTVIDLGRDVKPEVILEKAREANADVVCLSALMTTTMPKMKDVIDLFAEESFDCPVLIGGAATTRAFAEAIGAAGYGRDAQEAVEAASAIIERRGRRV